MKYKYLSFFYLLSICFSVSSQNLYQFKAKHGESFISKDLKQFGGFIAEDEQHIYSISGVQNGTVIRNNSKIQVFDKKLGFLEDKNLFPNEVLENKKAFKIFDIKGQFFVLSYEKSVNKNIKIFIHPILLSQAEIIDESIILGEFSRHILLDSFDLIKPEYHNPKPLFMESEVFDEIQHPSEKTMGFSLIQSANQNFINISSCFFDSLSHQKKLFTITFNQAFKKVYEKEMPLEVSTDVLKSSLDNLGNTYFLTKKEQGVRTDYKTLEVVRFSTLGKENWQLEEIKTDIKSANFMIDSLNNLHVFSIAQTESFYRNRIYYHQFSKAGLKNPAFNIIHLHDKMLKKIVSPEKMENIKAREEKKINNHFFNSLIIDNIHLSDSGKIYLTTENRWLKSVSGIGLNATEWHYHDIYIFKIKADGQMLWASNIPRFIKFENDVSDYGSYFSKMIDGVLILFFNAPENYYEEYKVQNKMSKNIALGAAYFMPDGKKKVKKLYTIENNEKLFSLISSGALQSQEAFYFLDRSPKTYNYRLSKIELNSKLAIKK